MGVRAEAYYESGRVVEVYLNIKNPVYADRYESLYDKDGNFVSERSVEGLKARGFDGIIDYRVSEKFDFQHLDGDTAHYIVFDSNQIKLIDNLNPTENEDIRYQNRVTPAEDAEYLELAKNPEKNEARLREMVDAVAKRAGYTTKAYHGTPSNIFTTFDAKKIGSNTDAGIFGSGFYFTTHKDTAGVYATEHGHTMSVYLRVNKPWWAVAHRNIQDVAEKLGMSEDALTLRGYGGKGRIVTPTMSQTGQFSTHLQERGYDAVVVQHGSNNYEIVVFDSNAIKSADEIAYDDNGNVIPLSERFNEGNEDIRYSDRYWHTGMSNAEVTRIERLVKHELPITDNFVDNITKWMYNNKGEYTYFALYSTEDEENPTVLYASKGERADADFDFVKYYNDFVNEMDGVNNDGRAESIDEIFSQYRSTDGLYPVNSGYDVGRENTTQTVRSHIGKSRRRLPSALRSCLQDCYRRRNSQRLLDDERLGDEMHQDRNMNGATFNGKPFWCGSVSLIDGVIEEVHTYEEAVTAEFHHTFYFSETQVEKIDSGENGFFWIKNGRVEGDWRESVPKHIIDKIKEQIKINTNILYQDRAYQVTLDDLGIDHKAENEKLKTDIERLKDLLKFQKTLTHGTAFSSTSVLHFDAK